MGPHDEPRRKSTERLTTAAATPAVPFLLCECSPRPFSKRMQGRQMILSQVFLFQQRRPVLVALTRLREPRVPRNTAN